jgi:hypothetical protein
MFDIETGNEYNYIGTDKFGKTDDYLRSVIWTLSIILMFCNHNVSRDGSSLNIR